MRIRRRLHTWRSTLEEHRLQRLRQRSRGPHNDVHCVHHMLRDCAAGCQVMAVGSCDTCTQGSTDSIHLRSCVQDIECTPAPI